MNIKTEEKKKGNQFNKNKKKQKKKKKAVKNQNTILSKYTDSSWKPAQ